MGSSIYLVGVFEVLLGESLVLGEMSSVVLHEEPIACEPGG